MVMMHVCLFVCLLLYQGYMIHAVLVHRSINAAGLFWSSRIYYCNTFYRPCMELVCSFQTTTDEPLTPCCVDLLWCVVQSFHTMLQSMLYRPSRVYCIDLLEYIVQTSHGTNKLNLVQTLFRPSVHTPLGVYRPY